MSHEKSTVGKWMMALGYLTILQCLDVGISLCLADLFSLDLFSTWVVITTLGFQLLVIFNLL